LGFYKLIIALMERGNKHFVQEKGKMLQIVERSTDRKTKLIIADDLGNKIDCFNLEIKISEAE